jgi:hypothetical protein
MAISLSANVNLQNYREKIPKIAKLMKPVGIEIYSLPENYPNNYQLKLPDRQEFNNQGKNRFSLLSERLANDIGRVLKQCGIRKLQYHYPWQKMLLNMNGHDLGLTVQFCDIILEKSGAEQMTINYHNVLKYPVPSVVKKLDGEFRNNILKMLEVQTRIAQKIKKQFGSRCLLIIENNSAAFTECDKSTGEKLFSSNVDFVAEDYINREGVEGTNLDYSHAWNVISCFNGNKKYPHLQWCRRQYGRTPESAGSMENFVRNVASKIKWIHICDELPYTHSGSHIGDGKIDFEECARLLNNYLEEEIVATIEVSDSHTPDGFKRILQHDFPFLKKIFGL